MMNAGTVYNIYAECRDIGYGVEIVGGHYVWTGEVDTWGKHTLVSCEGETTVYLFADEIVDAVEAYSVKVPA